VGAEVSEAAIDGGRMLYDTLRTSNFSPAFFEPEYWRGHDAIEGSALGRGTTWFIRSGESRFVLRHYRRGGLMAKVSKDAYLWRGESETRSFAEWYLTYHLYRAGLPVPAPIAARYRRQGVFYRASAREEAIRLGLAGEIRNLPDGRVEAVVEGARERIEEFVAWCRRGPPSAEVDDVEVRWSAASGQFRSFRVAH